LLEFLGASQFKNVAKFLVAGKGDPDYVDQIKARFRNAKCVFLGHVVPQLLFDQIDVLVVPSLWNEPMGRVPLEAASAGIPSIVANRGGLPETVTHGVTGFVFDPSDSLSLAECLASLASDNSRLVAMKNAAFESSLSHSEDHIASKYEEIYRDALALS
jgi:glycosyltransferase involved in cell wall biosynthesis